MRLKSYFVPSIQAAVDKARNELGPEAMLISSRPTDRALQQLGAYEVIFGLEGEGKQEKSLRPEQTPASGPGEFETGSQLVLRELAALRRQIEGVEDVVTRTQIERSTAQMSPHFAGMFNRLTGAGISTELAQELVAAVGERIKLHAEASHRMVSGQRDVFARDLLQAVLEEEIGSRFEVSPVLGAPGANTAAVMFAGPSGSGKTSSVIKAGLACGVKRKRPVQLLTLDTLRIGAWEQLQRYGRISGIDCRPLHDFADLETALAQAFQGLTLIDTPGFGANDSEELARLATICNKLPVEVHLVLPAHLSLKAAQRTWERFAVLQPAKLLVTHLDESGNDSAPLEFAIRSGLPVSFLSDGQQVPEDFRAATKEEFMRGLGAGGNRALSATA